MENNWDTSSDDIAVVVDLWKAGFSTHEVLTQTGLPQICVKKWLNIARETPRWNLPLQKNPPEKPMNVSQDVFSVIKHTIEVDPRMTARKLKEANPQLLGNVSERTVTCYIRYMKVSTNKLTLEKDIELPENVISIIKTAMQVNPRVSTAEIMKTYSELLKGVSSKTVTHYKNYIKVCTDKPLTETVSEQRVAFAKKYVTLPLKDVRAILWSDETSFPVTGTDKRLNTVSVWGAFSYHGIGKLVFLDDHVTALNGTKYLEMLYEYLPATFNRCKARVFQQNCKSYHSDRRVTQWLDFCKIDYLTDWPPNSYDLHLMEFVWDIVRRKLRKKDTRTLPKLKESLAIVWKSISRNVLRRLVDSFPERLEEILRKNGSSIKSRDLNTAESQSLENPSNVPGTSAGSSSWAPVAVTSVASSMDSNAHELLFEDDADLHLDIKDEVVDDVPDVDLVMDMNPIEVVEKKPSLPSASISNSDPLVVAESNRMNLHNSDEFHIFGMFVASQLRELPLREALQAQLEIQTLLTQKRSKMLM